MSRRRKGEPPLRALAPLGRGRGGAGGPAGGGAAVCWTGWSQEAGLQGRSHRGARQVLQTTRNLSERDEQTRSLQLDSTGGGDEEIKERMDDRERVTRGQMYNRCWKIKVAHFEHSNMKDEGQGQKYNLTWNCFFLVFRWSQSLIRVLMFVCHHLSFYKHELMTRGSNCSNLLKSLCP